MRAIVDTHLPKCVPRDIPLFNGIVTNMFHGVKLPQADNTVFLDAMEKVCKKKNLQFADFFKEKIVQTYETMNIRHGFVYIFLYYPCNSL